MKRPVLLVALCAAVVLRGGGQTRDVTPVAVRGTGVVAGIVMSDDRERRPLRRAHVALSRAGIEDTRRETTDDNGRFRFVDVPAGTFTIAVSKGGYVRTTFGAPQPGMPGRTISLADGEQVTDAVIALQRGAAIEGRLTTRHGQPAAGTPVQAAEIAIVDGRRVIRSTTAGRATTNAHGDYRIFGLKPGEYLVAAALQGSLEFTDASPDELLWARKPHERIPSVPPNLGYAPTMFPGTADVANATFIALAAGQERLGVDFTLQAVPISIVRGSVVTASGDPAFGVTVLRSPRDADALFPSRRSGGLTARDGTFVITNVPPGEHLLTARVMPLPARGAAGSAAPQTWAQTTIVATGGRVDAGTLRLQRGMQLSGHVVFSTAAGLAATTPDPRGITLAAAFSDPGLEALGTQRAVIGEDGAFTFRDLLPARYRIVATTTSSTALREEALAKAGLMAAPPGAAGRTTGIAATTWLARSVMLGNRDLLDHPIDITANQDVSGVVATFVDRLAEIRGTLVDAAGRTTPDFYVFVFSADRAHWTTGSRRIAFARAGRRGDYSIANLPPGDYYVCALTELDIALQYDPTYLEQFIPASLRVTLGERETRTQDFRVGGDTDTPRYGGR